jgi:hypothetical protein
MCQINQALDAVGLTATGGEVIIPAGTCIISPMLDPEQGNDPTRYLVLYPNLTIRGTGPKSVLKVSDASAMTSYGRIFSGTSPNNVVIKDFKIDQNLFQQPTCPPRPDNLPLGQRSVIAPYGSVHEVTISGMYFDPTDSPNTIFISNSTDVDLQATVTNNYFNFVKCQITPWYDVSTVLLEGSQQVIRNNTFTSPSIAHLAHTAIETLGGRSVIADNTFNNYAIAVLPVSSYGACPPFNPAQPACTGEIDPSDVVIANNSVTCAGAAISIWPSSGTTLRNVSITGNSLHICNHDRSGGATAGIATTWTSNRDKLPNRGYQGDIDGLNITNNLITMQKDTSSYDFKVSAGILLRTIGNLRNVLIKGNVIKDAPVSGIRVGPDDFDTSIGIPQHSVKRLRIIDNIIVDAGNNSDPNSDNSFRHAIGLLDFASDVEIMHNMIYDTGAPSPYCVSPNPCGKYALVLQPLANPPWTSTNVRTGRNTIRTATGQLLSAQGTVGTVGLADTTNTSDVLISTPIGPNAVLPVDFTSFTQYITTVSADNGLLTVHSPLAGATGVQWTVGQIVTFRFLCASSSNCTVTFDSAYSTVTEGVGVGNLPIDQGKGRAITFQVENWPTDSSPHKFFELYRSPTGGVPNP